MLNLIPVNRGGLPTRAERRILHRHVHGADDRLPQVIETVGEMPERFSGFCGGVDIDSRADERGGRAAVGDGGEEEVAEHPLKGRVGVSRETLAGGREDEEGGKKRGGGRRRVKGKAEGGGGTDRRWVKRPERTMQWY